MKNIDYAVIFLLCSLNNLSKIKKEMPEVAKINYTKSLKFHDIFVSQIGLNATSIADITGIPRSTILRKIKFLLDKKLIYKDSKHLYSIATKESKFGRENIYSNLPIMMTFLSQYLADSFNIFK